MKRVLLIVIVFCSFSSIAQEITTKFVDSLYKEDQFYIGTTYNLLVNKPKEMAQSGFSLGFHLGFIKDMPINKRRNVAIGIGLGYSTNSYIQNMLINKNAQRDFVYSVIDANTNYSKNKFSEHVVELPIEFRWRTSTPSAYKFWRVYTGFKLGYAFLSNSKFDGDLGTIKFSSLKDYNNLQYGLTLSIGYDTWNLFMYYGLNSMFSENARINTSPLDMSNIKLGLLFYIL